MIGLPTQRDTVASVIAPGLNPATPRLGEAMPANALTASEDKSFLDLLRIVRGRGLRRLPLVRPGGVLGVRSPETPRLPTPPSIEHAQRASHPTQ